MPGQGNIATARQMAIPWIRETSQLLHSILADDIREVCRLQGLSREGNKKDNARRIMDQIERLWNNGDHENYGRLRAMLLRYAPANSHPPKNAAILPVGHTHSAPPQPSMAAPVAGLAAAIQQVGLSDDGNLQPHSSPSAPVDVGAAGVPYPSRQVSLGNSNRVRRAAYVDAATSTDDLDVPRNLKWWDRTPQNPPRRILPYHKFLKNIKEESCYGGESGVNGVGSFRGVLEGLDDKY